MLLSLGGTVLYLLQAEVVSGATQDAAERTRIFATIDLWVGRLADPAATGADRAADQALRHRPRRRLRAAGLRVRLQRAGGRCPR